MIILSDRQFELVKSINAVMSVVEGHAEHVMDMACPDQIPSLPKLRNSMSKRRSSQGPLWKVISKILGMDMKMRQYQLGREFCDHVVGDAGMSALNQVWTEPAALPDTSELSDPEMWLRRVAA
jgi:putative hydrolase